MSIYIIVALVAFIASLTQRVSGFGFGMLFMTAAPFLMPTYPEATTLSGALALVCALVTGVQMVRFVPWKKLLPILCTFLVVSFVSIRFVGRIDGKMMRGVLGAVLLFLSFYFSFIRSKISMKPTMKVQVGMGTVSGVMGGLFAMQGPPAVIYFISCADNKEEYMAITQWYFIISNSFMTVSRAASGFFTPTVGKAWLFGVAAVILGLMVGKRIYSRMPIEIIRKVVYVIIGVSGLLAIILSLR
ncbi:MAG: sulfite exporter TauE/SafE family protein [Bacteroidales bacterium]|nr:sulfite exporter TauE/SafE family protein [Bacteroidales bacterium]